MNARKAKAARKAAAAGTAFLGRDVAAARASIDETTLAQAQAQAGHIRHNIAVLAIGIKEANPDIVDRAMAHLLELTAMTVDDIRKVEAEWHSRHDCNAEPVCSVRKVPAFGAAAQPSARMN